MAIIRPEQRIHRYEFKYWIEPHMKQRLLAYLLNFMQYDPNNADGEPYKICSLYLDTRDLTCYYEKYNGDMQRRKYRIRAYNDDYSNVVFEIKAKNNIYIQKFREFHSLGDQDFTLLPDMLNSGDPDFQGPFSHACRVLGLAPVCWVAYRRTALTGRNNPKLRVTFDEGLSGTPADSYRLRHMEAQSVFLSHWRRPLIMEIKFDYYLPHWLERCINWLERCIKELNLSHESISKYGFGINRFHFNYWPERQWTH